MSPCNGGVLGGGFGGGNQVFPLFGVPSRLFHQWGSISDQTRGVPPVCSRNPEHKQHRGTPKPPPSPQLSALNPPITPRMIFGVNPPCLEYPGGKLGGERQELGHNGGDWRPRGGLKGGGKGTPPKAPPMGQTDGAAQEHPKTCSNGPALPQSPGMRCANAPCGCSHRGLCPL